MSTLKSSRNSIRLWENPCFTSVSSSLFLTKSNTSSTFSSLTGHAPSSMSNSWRYSLLLSWHGNKWKLGCLGLPWSVLNTMIKVLDNSTECYMYYVMVVKSWIPKLCLGCTGSKDFLVHSTGKNIIFLCKSNETSIFFGSNGNFVFCLLFNIACATPKPFTESWLLQTGTAFVLEKLRVHTFFSGKHSFWIFLLHVIVILKQPIDLILIYLIFFQGSFQHHSCFVSITQNLSSQ